ncbi:MAG: hypothetical protein ACR2FH_09390 [Caulobacteraceae bacterium]
MKSARALALLAIGALLAPGMAAAQSADEMIAKHVAARGGLAALRAIKSLKMTGILRPAGFDAQLTYDETVARPGKVRIDATIQGLTIVQAYDGAGGWQIQPFQGRKDAEILSADDIKTLQEEADFEGALIDAKAKGATVESLGNVDVDGAPAWALRATLKNGDQQTYYLDPDAGFTVRIVTRQLLRGAETLTQTAFGDYEKVAGVYFPFEVASGPKGSTVQQRITYYKILANRPVDAAIFAVPKAVPAPTAPSAPVPTQAVPGVPVPTEPSKPPVARPPAQPGASL